MRTPINEVEPGLWKDADGTYYVRLPNQYGYLEDQDGFEFVPLLGPFGEVEALMPLEEAQRFWDEAEIQMEAA